MDADTAHIERKLPAYHGPVVPGAGAGRNGSCQENACTVHGNPTLEALRRTQARRAAQERRRHAKMDREIAELVDSEE